MAVSKVSSCLSTKLFSLATACLILQCAFVASNPTTTAGTVVVTDKADVKTTTTAEVVNNNNNKDVSDAKYNVVGAMTSGNNEDDEDNSHKNKPMFTQDENIAIYVCFGVWVALVAGVVYKCTRKNEDFVAKSEVDKDGVQTTKYVANSESVKVNVGGEE